MLFPFKLRGVYVQGSENMVAHSLSCIYEGEDIIENVFGVMVGMLQE
jgi:hypothetical protein